MHRNSNIKNVRSYFMIRVIIMSAIVIVCSISSVFSSEEEKTNGISFRELLHITEKSKGKGIFLSDNHRPFGKKVYFVVTVPLTINPDYSNEIIAAADYAALNINEQGGVNGHRLEIIRIDDMGSSGKAVELISKAMKEYSIKAIIGPMATERALGVANNIAIPNKLPMIPPLASANAISQLDDDGWVFQIFDNNAQQSKMIAQFALQSKAIKRVTMIGDQSLYTKELQEDVTQQLTSQNINIDAPFNVSHLINYQSFNLKEKIDSIETFSPNMMMISVRPHQIVDLLSQLELYWKSSPPILLFTDTGRERLIKEQPLNKFEQCMYIVSTEDRNISNLNKRISKAFNKDIEMYNTGFIYDSVVLSALSYAVSEKYKLDFREVMLSVTNQGEQWTTAQFNSMVSNYKKGSLYRYLGETGSVHFDKKGNNQTNHLSVAKLHPRKKCHYFDSEE